MHPPWEDDDAVEITVENESNWYMVNNMANDVYSSRWPTIFPQTAIKGETILPQKYTLFLFKMLQNKGVNIK